MKPFAKNVGPMIREARLKIKRSQGELAHLLGYNCKGQIISNVERHKCNAPTWLLPRLSLHLQIDFNTLMKAHLYDVYLCEEYEAKKERDKFSNEAHLEYLQRIMNETGISASELHSRLCEGY